MHIEYRLKCITDDICKKKPHRRESFSSKPQHTAEIRSPITFNTVVFATSTNENPFFLCESLVLSSINVKIYVSILIQIL